jgi:hypothetical protein
VSEISDSGLDERSQENKDKERRFNWTRCGGRQRGLLVICIA